MTEDEMWKRENWVMVRPGLYVDAGGYGHMFPDEVIAELSRLHPEVQWKLPEDHPLIEQVLDEVCAKCRCPRGKIFVHHKLIPADSMA